MKPFYIFLISFVLFSCSKNNDTLFVVSIKNDMPFDRAFETVEINISNLNLKNNGLVVFDEKKRKNISSQLVDNNLDGQMDVLLFQPEVASNSKILVNIKYSNKEQKIENYCYSRFVPERTDDYAWENNRVAFRTFGPTAQNMVEQNIKGGTLTSGIDAWLKRVEYTIINKWYNCLLYKSPSPRD